ncbi:MAG: thiamine phosphate synthase [Bauldia sp.]|nr:thiamine phosphate synthase [Bauldia sp.]
MANATDIRCRLCLVTPPDYEPKAFASRLADALAGGDVASLIVTAPRGDEAALQAAAEALVPIAEARGVAALIHNDTRIAGRTAADGVHIDTGVADVRTALETLRNRKIVGAGGIRSRHDALELGGAEPDYLFFGRLDGDTAERIFPKALELAAWWSSVTIIPAIVMGGRSLASVDEAIANGIGFVALSSVIWNHAQGAGAAVAEASDRLAMVREPAA